MANKKIIKLSATRINTFLQCKLKYWFNYYEHLPKVPNPAFKLGTACHEALEYAGKIWKDNFKLTKADIKDALKVYEEVAIREGINDPSVYKEGITLVKARLNDFDLGRKIISIEEDFQGVSTSDGVPLIGAMDKVVEVDDDTLLVVDYKTSKTAPNIEALRNDIQLSMYDLVASLKYPQYKRIIVSLDMLRGDVLYSYRTSKEREEFSRYLKLIYDQMTTFTKKEAKPELHVLCPWCDYKDYCDTYKEACEKTDYNFLPTSNYNAEELISEWRRTKDVKRILEQRERELSMIIIEKIKANNVNLVSDLGEVYIRQNSRKNYDLNEVARIIPEEDLIKVTSLNSKLVEAYAQSNPALKERILSSAQVNYTTPFLDIRKNKGKGK